MNMLLKNFPTDVHQALKIRAIQENKTMYILVIEILRRFVDEKKRDNKKV